MPPGMHVRLAEEPDAEHYCSCGYRQNTLTSHSKRALLLDAAMPALGVFNWVGEAPVNRPGHELLGGRLSKKVTCLDGFRATPQLPHPGPSCARQLAS